MSDRDTYVNKTSAKGANYWQCVLRFGLPFTIIYQGIDYAIFRIVDVGIQYPWRVKVAMDIPFMFFMATLWWGLMRQLAIWKQKSQQR